MLSSPFVLQVQPPSRSDVSGIPSHQSGVGCGLILNIALVPGAVGIVETEVTTERAENAANRIGMVIMAATRMIDGIPAGAVRAPFKQAQFSQQQRMIRQLDEPPRK